MHHETKHRGEDGDCFYNSVLQQAVRGHDIRLRPPEIVSFLTRVGQLNHEYDGGCYHLPRACQGEPKRVQRLYHDTSDPTQRFPDVHGGAHTLPHATLRSGEALALQVGEPENRWVRLTSYTVVDRAAQSDIHVLFDAGGREERCTVMFLHSVQPDTDALDPRSMRADRTRHQDIHHLSVFIVTRRAGHMLLVDHSHPVCCDVQRV